MTTYRLGSSPLVLAPGLIAWAINGYAFPRDRETMVKVIAGTWATVPRAAVEALLSKRVSYRIEDEVVVFDAYVKTDPIKIPVEAYWEALECMPPSRFTHCQGVELFHICEHLTDDLVSWYATTGGTYFTFNDTCHLKAGEVAEKVKAAA